MGCAVLYIQKKPVNQQYGWRISIFTIIIGITQNDIKAPTWINKLLLEQMVINAVINAQNNIMYFCKIFLLTFTLTHNLFY